MNITHVVSFALLACSAVPAFAQERDSVFDQLIAEALKSNPSIAQRQAAAHGAQLRIRPAGALPDPMFTAGVMDLLLPGFKFNQSDFTEVDAELSQELPWPGLLGARTNVARAVAAGARADERTTRREITFAMAEAYYRLQYAVAALATIERQLALLDAAVQVSTTRYGTGSAPQSDPLQAKLARDRLQLEAFTLESERVSAQAAVNALRNRALSDSVALLPIDAAQVRAALPTFPSADSLVGLTLRNHPRLAAREASLAQATQLIRVERLGARPDFTLTARYGYRPPFVGLYRWPGFFSAFLGLRLPVWAWRKQNRLADAARADSVAAAADLHKTVLALSREVTEAVARVQASQQRLTLLEDRVLPAAQGTVESVLRSYQVGRAEFLTLITVEDARYRAELEAAAVAAEYQTQLVMLRQLTAEESLP